MRFHKLSLKNIQKSFKDYAIYFFTLILGVAIFYVFNAIDSQTVLLNTQSYVYELIKMMTNMLSGVSVFVSVILGFLIIYASRFLIKRRHKEFGIYMLLGMSKRKISMILFFETLFIGILSLGVGLILGVVLSQFMSILVANMFEADMTSFTFIVSKSAIIKTLIYFGIMYFLVMIFNTISISKCKLIDLLHSEKKSEQVKLKNPILCTILFLIAVAMLSYAYYCVTIGAKDLYYAYEIFIPIGLGCLATFLIFFSLSGLLLRIFMSMKGLYYRGLNSFTLRQISSKVNTTVFSMTIICLMLFLTICVFSASLSLKNSLTQNLEELTPVDISISKRRNFDEKALEDGWSLEQIEDSKKTIPESFLEMDFDYQNYFEDIFEFNVYTFSDMTIANTLGSVYDEIVELYPFLSYDTAEEFVSLSDYNKLARMYGLDELSLRDNEYAIVADYDQWITIRNDGLKANTPLVLNGKSYYPNREECIYGFMDIASNHINIGFFVVPDEVLNAADLYRSLMVANYKGITDVEKEHIEKVVHDLEDNSYALNSTLSVSTKLTIYAASVGLGAMVTFIGLYLGLIFLISSAAILALKELSESTDNKERFQMLRNLGADEKMINKALFYQILIFFLCPLLLACIHSVFGILFCNYILESMGTTQLLTSIFTTAGFLIFIYGGYFLITYYCSKNIIKER